jgi:predicted dehydrogenase
MTYPKTVRVGVLGAAKVAPMALINPAQGEPEVEVLAVAARNGDRARAFAEAHGIPRAYDSYDTVLADPDVTAVYIPLPASANGRWTLAALSAGKHVLVEKPMAANAQEAERVRVAAVASGRVVFQGYHYRYHPFLERVRRIVENGAIGRLTRVSARFTVQRPPEDNIRWRYELGGGTLMDHGSYPVHLARTVVGREPSVVWAKAVPQPDTRNDGTMDVELDFGDAVTGRVHASMLGEEFHIGAELVGTEARLAVTNFVHPTMGNELRLSRADGTESREVFDTSTPTFRYQLRAFAEAVLRGKPFPTDAADGVANLRVIDAAYIAAGLPTRVPLT